VLRRADALAVMAHDVKGGSVQPDFDRR
jgi:hypothetical protein